MITVKPKLASLIILAAMITVILAGNTADAQSLTQSVHLSITVVGSLSLNIDETTLSADAGKPKAEAFSHMTDHGILVSRLVGDDSNTWLFTKTE